jgi:predicted nucleic acid-binding protein
VAILSERDQHHASCLEASKGLRGPFFTAWPVVTEAAYLLRGNSEAVESLLRQVRDGKLQLLELGAADIVGILQIRDNYREHSFDLADASLMHLADRENIKRVFTTDQRHFSVFRNAQGMSLEFVPLTR